MKQFIQKYAVYGIVGIAIILFIIGLFNKPVETNAEIMPTNTESEQIVEKAYIYVDVKGAVLYPGVYKVEKDSRLFQVISLAGGLMDEADGNAINLSIILSDQDVIYIPTIGEEYPNVVITEDAEIGGVININTATLEQLKTLSGIGPSTAQSIIDYRYENGSFEAIEDIMNVSGIGESTFANIKDFITV